MSRTPSPMCDGRNEKGTQKGANGSGKVWRSVGWPRSEGINATAIVFVSALTTRSCLAESMKTGIDGSCTTGTGTVRDLAGPGGTWRHLAGPGGTWRQSDRAENKMLDRDANDQLAEICRGHLARIWIPRSGPVHTLVVTEVSWPSRPRSRKNLRCSVAATDCSDSNPIEFSVNAQ